MSDIPKRIHFPKVKEAREALKERAVEIQDMMMKVAKQALDTGDHESAFNTLKWLSEHMPSEDGVTMVDASIDSKSKAEMGPKGPQIQIGIQLGGMPHTKELPPSASVTTVIDVLPDVIEESCQTSKPQNAQTLLPVNTTSRPTPPSVPSVDDKPSS